MARRDLLGTRQASELDRLLAPASLAGMIAAACGAAVAMAGTWLAGSGLFTPLYGVTQTLSRNALNMSLHNAQTGNDTWFVRDQAVAGGAVLLMLGGVLGMLFIPVARRVSERAALRIGAGVLYGLAVLGVITVTGMSSASRLVMAQQPMSELSSLTGWAILLGQYAVYGAALGVWVAWRPGDLHPAPATDTVVVVEQAVRTS